MPQRLLALIAGFAIAAVPATAVAAPSQLHDCGTKVEQSVGTGWCSGTGTFSIQVTCADGTSVTGSWIRVTNGYGVRSLSCSHQALATGVTIVEAP
ncbi:hypothetical protein [Umezawaea sp.]|uniref:hypothetical protein n=1 Tax=Umezawaea sp. TaxID=1955258 RepID=UPI002ED3F472